MRTKQRRCKLVEGFLLLKSVERKDDIETHLDGKARGRGLANKICTCRGRCPDN